MAFLNDFRIKNICLSWLWLCIAEMLCKRNEIALLAALFTIILPRACIEIQVSFTAFAIRIAIIKGDYPLTAGK